MEIVFPFVNKCIQKGHISIAFCENWFPSNIGYSPSSAFLILDILFALGSLICALPF